MLLKAIYVLLCDDMPTASLFPFCTRIFRMCSSRLLSVSLHVIDCYVKVLFSICTRQKLCTMCAIHRKSDNNTANEPKFKRKRKKTFFFRCTLIQQAHVTNSYFRNGFIFLAFGEFKIMKLSHIQSNSFD